MRIFAVTLLLAALAACNNPDQQAAKQKRIFDTQRDALEKAKTVNDTVQQADQARRQQEESQSQ